MSTPSANVIVNAGSNPSSGALFVPVANCNSCPRSSLVNDFIATQKNCTGTLDFEYPPVYFVWLAISSTLMSFFPFKRRLNSVGVKLIISFRGTIS